MSAVPIRAGRPIEHIVDGQWRDCVVAGSAVPFAPVLREDDHLHPAASDAHYSAIETNLYGFNIPAADINCNIYALWHPVLRTLSVQMWVLKGARVLPHQLAADYFIEYLFLPAVDDIADWSVEVGGFALRIAVDEPLERITIQASEPARGFALDLTCTAALPPVGRPGGHHFTQLLKTAGTLTLDGEVHAIDGHYMRDRSWGYNRPEAPERTPPYRWMTGWIGDDCAFVVAWLDTALLEGAAFGTGWDAHVGGPDASGANKWESGGPTPSLNLRSGWIAKAGRVLPVTRLRFRTLTGGDSRLLVKAVELELTDSEGGLHHITGKTRSMIPKMYWGNLLTYMHAMALEMDADGATLTGAGDLMDTYSTWHIAEVGL
ncbi:hypothetical protein [Novosphingobium lentum]|uniref:hypothetical protein n=1 Tax=Novosphingobium lentum TaxID=145287 RepID=UPI00082A6C8D|nr:hypothetical protein [Novosphingobium lentum]